MRWRGDWQGYLLITPAYVLFAAFTFLPILWAFILSLQSYDLFTEKGHYIGLYNYQAAITNLQFFSALWNTSYFAVGSVVPTIAIGLLIATQLNRKDFRGAPVLQVVFFLPYIVSSVGASLIWKWLFDSNFGLINTALSWAHLGPIQWLVDPSTAMPALIIMAVWGNVGFAILLFSAGLRSIPKEVLEVAQVDGASRLRIFWRITFPLLAPTTLFVLIISMINAFQEFTMFQVMTQGGPLGATSVMVYYIYQQAFQFFNMGYGSALAIILLLITVLLTGLQLLVSKKYIYYEGERHESDA